MKKLYETERLVLGLAEAYDVHLIFDYFRRNRGFLKEFEPERDEDFFTLESFHEMIEYDKFILEKQEGIKYWILKKDKVIGSIALSNIVWGSFLNAFVGYRLDKDETGRGYMTEALLKVVDIAFNEFKLHRLEANIMPRNKASLAVVKKAGFVYEGIARQYLKINNVWEDHIHMIILNPKV